jgi:hypothetical protein
VADDKVSPSDDKSRDKDDDNAEVQSERRNSRSLDEDLEAKANRLREREKEREREQKLFDIIDSHQKKTDEIPRESEGPQRIGNQYSPTAAGGGGGGGNSKNNAARKGTWTTHMIKQEADKVSNNSDANHDFNAKKNKQRSIHGLLCNVDPDRLDLLYSKNYFSVLWVLISVAAHSAQFYLLLDVAWHALKGYQRTSLIILASLVPVLLLSSTAFVRTRKVKATTKYTDLLTPDDETDEVKDVAIWLLVAATVVESVSFAALTAACANDYASFHAKGYHSQQTMIQILQFGAVTFYALHRCVRPANRCDPLRTMFELEVVSVCWDALDGASIFELIFDLNVQGQMTLPIEYALRVLLCWWYVSVGVRTSVMLISHLPPDRLGYKIVMTQPLKLAPEPTVDRTLQALRLRSLVTTVMSFAELYAAGLRIAIWSKHQLSQLQMEMCIKNLAFCYTIYGASEMYNTTKRRDWNTRELGLGIEYPSRMYQLKWSKRIFICLYIVQGMLLNYYIASVSDRPEWYSHSLSDCVLCWFFSVYCANAYRKATPQPRGWFKPQDGFVVFPKKLGTIFSVLLGCNLFLARIPMLYYNYNNFSDDDSYANALFSLSLSVVVIAAFSMYWYLSNMMFHKEFTASPGDYNSIHDPLISMVSMTTQIEGAMDVLSCVVLMQLAANEIPSVFMNTAIVIAGLLELFNASMCFAMQALLSNGADDTPKDLIRVKAYMRGVRVFIDLGVFILRVVLWVQFNALTSVFLVKNLYNLIHTACQIERYGGVKNYPKYTLFTESVPSFEWYGMTDIQQWRRETGAHR